MPDGQVEIMTGLLKQLEMRQDPCFYRPGGGQRIAMPAGREIEVTIMLDDRRLAELGVPRTKKEKKMRYEAHLVKNRSNKTVDVHMQKITKEDSDVEVYLNPDGDEVERKIGENMPVYMTIPQEFFEPIVAAARNGDFG